MIAIEGCDRTGKTTLAKAIAKEFGGIYHHHGVPDAGQSHIGDCYNALRDLPNNTIFDRFAISAFVYDFKHAKSNVPMTSLDDIADVFIKFKSMNGLIIYAHSSENTLRRRYKEDPKAEAFINEHELIYVSRVYSLVMNYFNRSPYPTIFNYPTPYYNPISFFNTEGMRDMIRKALKC